MILMLMLAMSFPMFAWVECDAMRHGLLFAGLHLRTTSDRFEYHYNVSGLHTQSRTGDPGDD